MEKVISNLLQSYPVLQAILVYRLSIWPFSIQAKIFLSTFLTFSTSIITALQKLYRERKRPILQHKRGFTVESIERIKKALEFYLTG